VYAHLPEKIYGFGSIFRYLTKKPFAAKAGISCNRFQYIRFPSSITPTEMLQIAKILEFDLGQLLNLLN
jgi:hypothetical protein